tara:strand:+ start:11416 stop:12072 length:657 start_codon:yes stop_codon:yes gene_type:complete
MTNNVNKVMDLLKEIKTSFSNKFEKFAQAVLSDGTVIEWDGDLEVGVACFVVSGDERIPAPEGTHQMTGDYEGVSIITDAEGIVTEVISEVAEETPAETPEEDAEESSEEASSEEMSTEENIEETTDENVSVTLSADDVENIVNGKLSTLTDKISEMFTAITETNTELKNELTSLKEDYETFKNKPSVDSVESEKFARVKDAKDLTSRQIWLKNRMNK